MYFPVDVGGGRLRRKAPGGSVSGPALICRLYVYGALRRPGMARARQRSAGAPPSARFRELAPRLAEVPRLRGRPQASTIPCTMLSETRVRQLLEPFGLNLPSGQLNQILTYLDLLLRWNQKINLTAIRNPEECVARHFGESLFLARHEELRGSLLDIGSGAGFPGLALKIPFPELAVTLLEPVAKKRAFLKEAARVCGFNQVAVRPERLEEFVRTAPPASFNSATSRAVGKLERLVPQAAQCLEPGGSIFLWLTRDQGVGIASIESGVAWGEPRPIPLSRTGVILPGKRKVDVARSKPAGVPVSDRHRQRP